MPVVLTPVSTQPPIITGHSANNGSASIQFLRPGTNPMQYFLTSTTSTTVEPSFSGVTATSISSGVTYFSLSPLTNCTSTSPVYYYIYLQDTTTLKTSSVYTFCAGAPNLPAITQLASSSTTGLTITYATSTGNKGYDGSSINRIQAIGFKPDNTINYNSGIQTWTALGSTKSPWIITDSSLNLCSKIFLAMGSSKTSSPAYTSGLMTYQLPDLNNTLPFTPGAGTYPKKPAQPFGVSMSSSSENGNIYLSFSTITPTPTGYRISTDGGTTFYEISSTLTTTVTVTIASDTGLPLKPNTQYFVQIWAKNAVGLGIPSDIKTVTVLNTNTTLPLVATDVTCASSGGNSLDVTITPPSGTVTSYYWQCVTTGTAYGRTWNNTTVRTFNIPSLIAGTTYDVYVVSANLAGCSTNMFKVSATVTSDTLVAPSAPSALSIVAGDATLAVTITPPTDASTVTGYSWIRVLKDAPVGAGTWTDTTSTTFTISGLTNYTDYDVYVKATNSAGSSPSLKSTSKPYPAPSAPRSLNVDERDSACTVTFQPPLDSSIITGYRWQLLGLGESISVNGWNLITGTSFNISSLTNYVAYTVYVDAYNSVGISPFVYTQFMTYPPPSPPLRLLATPGSGTLKIDITPPTDGSVITGYRWQDTVDGTILANTVPAGQTQFTVPDLTNYQTYKIFVESVNDVGDSASTEISAMPYPAPSAPQSLSVAAFRSGEVDITIVRPSDESVITNYLWQVVVKDALITEAWNSTSSTSFTVTGLVNGTEYDLYVKANNSVGSSTASKIAIMASTIPSAPSDLSYTSGDHILTVSFQVASNGGKIITSYNVSTDGGVTFANFSQTALPIVISKESDTLTNLTNGKSYSIVIKAVNDNGESLNSSTLTAIPSRKPLAPTITQIIPGLHKLNVYFTQTDTDAGAPVQDIQYKLNDAAYVSSGTTTSPLEITGLTDLETYSVALKAVNSTGSSDASNTESMIVTDKPSKPIVSIVERSLTGYKLRLEWTDENPVAPSDQFTIYKNNQLFKVITPE